MARRREAQPPAEDEDRSGWAHYERVGPHELDYVEPCPSPFGPQATAARRWPTAGAVAAPRGPGCVIAGWARGDPKRDGAHVT